MKLHGSLANNLEAALTSARRLKGHPIHKDTLVFWSDLRAHARVQKNAAGSEVSDATDKLLADLQTELSARG
jgi:hypothetical protein